MKRDESQWTTKCFAHVCVTQEIDIIIFFVKTTWPCSTLPLKVPRSCTGMYGKQVKQWMERQWVRNLPLQLTTMTSSLGGSWNWLIPCGYLIWKSPLIIVSNMKIHWSPYKMYDFAMNCFILKRPPHTLRYTIRRLIVWSCKISNHWELVFISLCKTLNTDLLPVRFCEMFRYDINIYA